MASLPSQLIEEITVHAQSDSLEDAREICADGTHFPNNLRTMHQLSQLLIILKCFTQGLYHLKFHDGKTNLNDYVKIANRCKYKV